MFRVLIFFTALNGIICAKFPSDVQKCKYTDSNCITRVANQVIAKASQGGYPELGLPAMDPLALNKLVIDQGGDRPVQLNFEFTNAKIYGFSSLKFTSLEGFGPNIEKAKIDIKFHMDKIQSVGPYKARGKILILPMNGDGHANVTYDDISAHAKLLTKKVVKNGKDYMQIDKLKLSFVPNGSASTFTNLFNGNQQLSEHFITFINENWRDIFEDLKFSYYDSIGAILKSIINNVFLNIPYDEFFEK